MSELTEQELAAIETDLSFRLLQGESRKGLERLIGEIRRLREQEKRSCMLAAYLAGLAGMAPYVDWLQVRVAMGVPLGHRSLTVQDYAARGRALVEAEQQKEATE